MTKIKAVKIVTKNYIKNLGKGDLPKVTATYRPYPHIDMVNMVNRQLAGHGFKTISERFQISHDHSRMFVTALIPKNDKLSDKHITMVGYRNSYDKTAAAGFGIGAQVVVCSNMSFFADLIVKHKHTINIVETMAARIEESVKMIADKEKEQLEFFKMLRRTILASSKSKNIMLDAVELKIIDGTDLKVIRDGYASPAHKQFKRGTAWALYNAFTTAMKRGFQYKPLMTMNKSIELNEVFNENI